MRTSSRASSARRTQRIARTRQLGRLAVETRLSPRKTGDKIFMEIDLLFIWTSKTAGNWIEHETILGGTSKLLDAQRNTGDRLQLAAVHG